MRRSDLNPLITRTNIVSTDPRLKDPSSVFNPGAIMFKGNILLLLRIQNRARETYLLKAVSQDGIYFKVDQQPVVFNGLDSCPFAIYHIYDPRITKIEDRYFVLCALDTNKGCYTGIFETKDFCTLELISIDTGKEYRNAILFPALFDGSYCRFERPNNYVASDGVKTGQSITCSLSRDLIHWETKQEVYRGRHHYWDELIGSGPPPLKTKAGWLHIYHGVATHFGSSNIYQAGVSLHDLHQPWITIARGRYNILEPRELYELTGQVPNVVFPSGAIAQKTDAEGFIAPDSPIIIYYGAADSCVCRAQTTVNELMEELDA